jgi:hypothetical protein
MGTISYYLHLRVNLKEKIYLYYQKVLKQNKETFLIEIFFPFATGVNNTGDAPGAVNISANFRKI